MFRCSCAKRQTRQLQLQASNLGKTITLSELFRIPYDDANDLEGTSAKLGADEQSMVGLFKEASSGVVFVTNNKNDSLTGQKGGGTGSGFVWDDKGHIVTNAHVVHGADSLMVSLGDKKQYPAQLVAQDPDTDIAVLRVQDKAALAQVRPCKFGSSANLQVGQTVLAIGNPFGLDHTLTTGVVSGTERTIEAMTGKPISGAIQTDAAINPGNSGGPLLNSSGQVIGINSQIMSGSKSSAGIGFAVPIDTVKIVVQELIAHGKITRASLGLVLGNKETLQAVAEDSNIQGVLILGVGGAAEAAGIKATERKQDGNVSLGDVIQEINGTVLNEAQDLFKVMATLKPGEQASLKILHLSDKSTETLSVKLGKVDSNEQEKGLEAQEAEQQQQQQQQQLEGQPEGQGFLQSFQNFFR